MLGGAWDGLEKALDQAPPQTHQCHMCPTSRGNSPYLEFPPNQNLKKKLVTRSSRNLSDVAAGARPPLEGTARALAVGGTDPPDEGILTLTLEQSQARSADNPLGAEYPSPKRVNLSIMRGLYKPKKAKGYLLSY